MHDCTGPFTLLAGVHLAFAAPNAIYQETVRAYIRTWYRDLVPQSVTIENGHDPAADGARHRHDLAARRREAAGRAGPDHAPGRPVTARDSDC